MDANPNIDPLYSASAAANITTTLINRWNTAYGRGDYHAMHYLTGYTETDPIWNAAKNNYYTKTEIDLADYLTTETDPIFSARSGDYYSVSNPENYISATSVPWTTGANISNTNTGEVHINTNLFASGRINI